MANPYEAVVIRTVELRSAAAQNTPAFNFGKEGFRVGILSFENDLDQNVTLQLQGKADEGSTWINVGAAAVAAAGGTQTLDVTAPWSLLRVQYTAAGIPTTGTISGWLNVARY